ncbi:MAG: hypothetical protein UV95_C0001G0326 [Candidatus Falkowbacteria bacterium GW2011_GWF2_43_32]|nr:MAG: hypothetical protein UV95_C0001G0326 [Candidatus Falkowbacteria bacterium GW2011_GWF2_43_32]
MFKKYVIFSLFLIIGFGLLGAIAKAQGNILPPATGDINVYNDKGDPIGNSCPGGDATYCGIYTVNDFMVMAINISKWILGIVGSLSLIMFIYGGFTFLISAGSSEAISKAKKIIVASVIGLIIVFSSYLIIKFVMGSLGIAWSGGTSNQCAATYGSQGYSCMDNAIGQNCRTGLCPGASNIQCCQPKP